MVYFEVIIEEVENKSRINFLFDEGLEEKYVIDLLNEFFSSEMRHYKKHVVDDFTIIKVCTTNNESLANFKIRLEDIKYRLELLNNFSLN